MRLIAVTKTVAPPRIAEAVAAGVTEVGENRVQEARLKHAGVPPGVRWHLIGHLQSNKAALAAQLFDTVHSLDSARVGAALARHRDPAARPDPGPPGGGLHRHPGPDRGLAGGRRRAAAGARRSPRP